MDTGEIFHINRVRGMFSVKLNDGSFSVIETSQELEKDNVIQGNLRTLGFEILHNETENERFDAIIQNYDCSENTAEERCFLK